MARVERARGFVLVVALAAVAILLLGLPSSAIPVGSSLRTESSPATSTVSFNGVNVASHTSLGSAIPTAFSGIFNTTFTWSSTGTPVFVTQGEVSLLFFGAAIGTSSEQLAEEGHGTFTLKSDFSQNQYLFEGAYQIQASLLSNGTTVFTQDFYIWVQATDHLTVVNIALLLIGILEVWQIAALGSVKKARQQLGIAPPTKGAPPSSPPSTLPSTPPSTPPATPPSTPPGGT